MNTIPTILHQSWADESLPPALEAFRKSWLRHHPDWERRLWTDSDNREFLAGHYDWFLPIYDSYPEEIMRVDAVRYFILYHFGGVYADLDAECLRPLTPLLQGKEVVLGLEHQAHLSRPLALERSLSRIVGNAIMASVPGHPFWEHVFKRLVACHRLPGPLDATGPFFLTRAYDSYPGREQVRLEAPELLSPIHNETVWSQLGEVEKTKVLQEAYVIHHWHGTWWRKSEAEKARRVKVSLLRKGEVMDVSMAEVERYPTLLREAGPAPMVSCLMVTRNRAPLARRAMECFRRQSYPNKELVIVDDGQDDTLQEWLREVGDPRITYLRLPDEGRPLGELRNLAVERARGSYVAQWDDDDLSDPRRLAVQMGVIRVLKTDACFLERHQIWWPESRRLALSTRRIWEGSFVCARDKLPPIPMPGGERIRWWSNRL